MTPNAGATGATAAAAAAGRSGGGSETAAAAAAAASTLWGLMTAATAGACADLCVPLLLCNVYSSHSFQAM